MRIYNAKHPYKREIENKIRGLQQQYSHLREYLPTEKDNDKWFKIVNEMNSISADIAIQKSRLDNYGKDVHLPAIIKI
jgi:hypothetical protein